MERRPGLGLGLVVALIVGIGGVGAALATSLHSAASPGPSATNATAAPHSTSSEPAPVGLATASASPDSTAMAGTPAPEASASLLPSPSPAPTETRPPSVLDRLPVISVPAAWIVRAPLDQAALYNSAIWSGSRLYSVAWRSANSVAVTLVDVSAGAASRTAGVVVPAGRAGETICVAAAGSQWLALLAIAGAAGPNSPPACDGYQLGEPIAWRLIAVPLNSAGMPAGPGMLVESGISRHLVWPNGEGNAFTQLPAVAVDGNRVAYDVDASVKGHPFATSILIRSLPDRGLVRSLTTQGQSYYLRLSGGTVAWSEDAGGEMAARQYAAVMASTATHPAPFQVWRTANVGAWAPEISLDGNAIAWNDPAVGRVLYTGLASIAPTQVSPAFAAQTGRCDLGELWGPRVAMLCSAWYQTADGVQHNWDATVVWSAGRGPAVVVGNPAIAPQEFGGASISGGWVVAQTSTASESISGVVAFPLAALAQ